MTARDGVGRAWDSMGRHGTARTKGGTYIQGSPAPERSPVHSRRGAPLPMSPQSPVVTVAVIDDHPVVAAGIAAW